MNNRLIVLGMLLMILCLSTPLQAEPTKEIDRGAVTIHFYRDMDNDSVYDPGEPSPPFFFVLLITHQVNLSALAVRFRIIGPRGTVTFHRLPYPARYRLIAQFVNNPIGIYTEEWTYDGLLELSEELIGTRLNLPVEYHFTPMQTHQK